MFGSSKQTFVGREALRNETKNGCERRLWAFQLTQKLSLEQNMIEFDFSSPAQLLNKVMILYEIKHDLNWKKYPFILS